MLRIRAQRLGRKNSPFFRLVVIDRKTSLTGSVIDIIGYYDPQKKIFHIEFKKILKWIKSGAKPSQLIATLYPRALFSLYDSKLLNYYS